MLDRGGALNEAYHEDRPSVPPRALEMSFETILYGAPLLSHLIERYHKDLGLDYFAFYREDPRDNGIASEAREMFAQFLQVPHDTDEDTLSSEES